MGYRVIENFSDMLCGGFEYKVGDSYPDRKFEVGAARIAALASNNNRLGRPLIKAENPAVAQEKVEIAEVEPIQEVETEVETEVKAEPKKRGRRKKAE